MENNVLNQLKEKNQKALAHLQAEMKKVRTGRAHPDMLEGITVEAYGQPMPLIQVATVSAPDPTLLQVNPFDPNNLEAIADAIRKDQSLGLNPTDDGKIIRVPIPPLTEERRTEMAKQLGGKQEEALVASRQARQDAMKAADDSENDQDDLKRLKDEIEKGTQDFKANVEKLISQKRQDIMSI
ncbi:MAG: ribosome recycling factor [bacterium]|nr:ribosome recycling factor [bacterium]